MNIQYTALHEKKQFGIKDKLLHWIVIPMICLPIMPFVILYENENEKKKEKQE